MKWMWALWAGESDREQKVSTDLGHKSFVLAPLLLAVDRTLKCFWACLQFYQLSQGRN